jgi:hypothetical protein
MTCPVVSRDAFLVLSRLQRAVLILLEEEGKVRIENEEVPGLNGGAGTGQTRQAPLKEAGR